MTQSTGLSQAPGIPQDWLVTFDPAAGELVLPSTPEDRATATVSEGGLTVFCSGRPDLAELAGEHLGDVALHLLHEYRHGGERGLHVLRGSYVILVHDAPRQTLLVLRDPMGYHSLFVSRLRRRIGLSPAQDPLLRRFGVSADVDPVLAAAWICERWLESERTILRDVTRVLPGHAIRVERRRMTIERWWRPHVPERPARIPEREAQNRFESVLQESMASALRWGRAGVFLSGGIDSATIAATAVDTSSRLGLPEPLLLCMRFPDPQSDESRVQELVAKELGLQPIWVSAPEALAARGVVRPALEAGAEVPGLGSAPWNAAWEILVERGREAGASVLLSGDGSDWLKVDRRRAADCLRKLDFGGLARLYSAGRARWDLSQARAARWMLWETGLRVILRDAALATLDATRSTGLLQGSRRSKLRAILPPWLLPGQPALRDALVERWLGGAPTRPTWDYQRANRMDLLDNPFMTVAMDSHLAESRRTGAPYLDPFTDAPLVELLLSFHPDTLLAGSREKGLEQAYLRRRFTDFDPATLRKATYETFFKRIVDGEGPRCLDALGGLPVLEALGIVAARPVQSLVRGGDSREFPRYYRLVWNLILLEAWLQRRVA